MPSVLVEYEARLQALQTGLAQVRAQYAAAAVGAVSTHDLALTDIAETAGLGGTNVHMSARAGGGPLDFDYRLKPGVTRESNALAIARMAGVPV
jgi:DNA mismatch repair ATPase MutS